MHTLIRPKHLQKSRRVGRGGKRGKTSGRGGKGQTARAGNKPRPEWRDIIKKLPKRRGFGRNRSRTAVPRGRAVAINFEFLSKRFKDGDAINPMVLVQSGVVRRVSGKIPPVVILAKGELKKKFLFEKVRMSQSARVAAQKAGSTITI